MTVKMVGAINSGSAAGIAGSATANANSDVILKGRVMAIYVKYNDTPPATTDVTIRTVGTSPSAPSYNLLKLTDVTADGWKYPTDSAHTVNGEIIVDAYVEQVVADYVNVLIEGANAGDSVDVWILLEY